MLEQIIVLTHIAAGLSAVICGFVAMRAPKRAGRHPLNGLLYLASLCVVCATAIVLVEYRPHTAFLLGLASFALATATLGYAARRLGWRGWLPHHIIGMSASYITLLTAFYVDNGPRLPLWELLPPVSFWFLPTAVGLPFLARALYRYTGKAAERHVAVVAPGPVTADGLVTGAPDDRAQDGGDDDGVGGVSEDRDEVGDQIDRQGQVDQQQPDHDSDRPGPHPVGGEPEQEPEQVGQDPERLGQH